MRSHAGRPTSRWWRARPHGRRGLEVFVHAPDRDGLFATMVIASWTAWACPCCKRACSIRADGTIFDTFQVLMRRSSRSDARGNPA
jgi:UTP:GlnB (protein PII) uridylyltransferase